MPGTRKSSSLLPLLLTTSLNPLLQSPFAQRCPHRLYESMISNLHKYPWHASQDTLLSDRKKLFSATLTCARVLSTNLRRAKTSDATIHANLTEALLQELAVAALGCPGFSEQQKANVVSVMQQQNYGWIADNAGMSVSTGGTARTASYWPFLVLIKRPGVEERLLDVRPLPLPSLPASLLTRYTRSTSR